MTRQTYREQNESNEERELFGALAQTINEEESLTQQQFKDDVDITVMTKRFGVDPAAVPPQALDPRYFGDFSNPGDFRDAMERVRAAENAFASLPAKLRDRFNNNPQKLLAFVNDPDNDEEAVKLGLLKKMPEKKEPEPVRVRVIADTPPASGGTETPAK